MSEKKHKTDRQTNRAKSHDLGIRTLINGVSALLIALLIFLAHYPALRWLFAAVVAAVGALAVWEYDSLVKKKGILPAVALSIITVILYIFAVFIKTQGPYSWGNNLISLLPVMILGAAFLASFIYFAIRELPPITHVSTTFFGILYIAIPLGLFNNIIFAVEGLWWIIYLIAVTKSADIGGYFIGSAFGKRKLALKLSPKKTLEGALGGLIASIVMSLILCCLGKKFGVFAYFTYLEAVGMGLLLGILGQIGDLAESFLKRDAGVKDSNTLPGVGGLLDMVDSLLFTAPLVYLYLKMKAP